MKPAEKTPLRQSEASAQGVRLELASVHRPLEAYPADVQAAMEALQRASDEAAALQEAYRKGRGCDPAAEEAAIVAVLRADHAVTEALLRAHDEAAALQKAYRKSRGGAK